MKVFAAILAGGTGTRMNSDKPKQFLFLGEKPVIIHSAEIFNSHPMIDAIFCISNSNFITEAQKLFYEYNIEKLQKIIPGGNTRQESSYTAVNIPEISDEDIILIHDAARPFITSDLISELIKAAENFDCAGTYIHSVDTIAIVRNGMVQKIPERNNIAITQTPQAFKAGIIRKCHESAITNGFHVTDDAALALKYGFHVKTVDGDIRNFKITNDGDIEKAELLLRAKK